MLVWGDEGWEVKVAIDNPDLEVVDAVAELEGALIDQYGELLFLPDVGFRLGHWMSSAGAPDMKVSALTQLCFINLLTTI